MAKTMIEQIARTLCKQDGHPENVKFEGKPMWASYSETARAILTKVREAAPDYVGDAYDPFVYSRNAGDSEIQTIAACFDAILASALAEE